MLNYLLTTHGDFTLVAVAPPDAITPEQLIRDHRSVRRGVCRTGSVPSFSVQVLCISKTIAERNSAGLKNRFIALAAV